MVEYRTILVTGGAGFVGSNLALWMKAHFPLARVIALDNLKRRGSELNLPRLRAGGVEFVHGDIRNKEDLQAGKEDIDLLIECSAEPSVLAGLDGAPDYLLNTNLLGTINCLELARRSGADLVFLSTSRVYPIETLNRLDILEMPTRYVLAAEQQMQGVTKDGITENFALTGARSLYGATKLCSELLIQEYGAMYGLRYIINRCGVLAGPWQMGKLDQGVFTLWVAMHYFERGLSYIGWGGSGKQVRDVLHVDDLAELIGIQLDHIADLNGSLFNVGGGTDCSLSLLETTALCQQITGKIVPIKPVEVTRPADMALYITDNSTVTRTTGWKPKRSAEFTIDSIYQWIKTEANLVRHLWV